MRNYASYQTKRRTKGAGLYYALNYAVNQYRLLCIHWISSFFLKRHIHVDISCCVVHDTKLKMDIIY